MTWQQAVVQLEGHAVLEVVVVMVGIDVHLVGDLDAARGSAQSFGDAGERTAPVVGDHDRVLDADATVFGEVDPGLDGDDVAGLRGRTSRLPTRPWGPRGSRGPTPCPVPCSEGVAPPRLGRSPSDRPRRPPGAATPAADGSTPGGLGLGHDVDHAVAARRSSSPTANVRVMSER